MASASNQKPQNPLLAQCSVIPTEKDIISLMSAIGWAISKESWQFSLIASSLANLKQSCAIVQQIYKREQCVVGSEKEWLLFILETDKPLKSNDKTRHLHEAIGEQTLLKDLCPATVPCTVNHHLRNEQWEASM